MTPAPIAPEVAGKLGGAIAALALLTEQTEEIATCVLKKDRGAEQKLSSHRARIRETETSIGELRFLLQVAEKTDERAAAEQRHHDRLASLAIFEEAVATKNKATAEFCRGAEITQKAYLAILDASHRMTNAVPAGTRLPAGMSTISGEATINGRAYPSNLESLAGAELYRHSGVDRIGKTGAMPGARALSHETIFDPSQIEPWNASTARVNEFLVRALREQIDAQHRAEVALIGASDV